MENVKIQFKGITRNTDDGICPDGECMELINAKVNNSSIEPIGNPIQLKQTVHTYKEIYHHANAKRYIGITEDGQMYEMPEDLSSETIMTEDVKAKSIQFIGNTVSVLTDTGVKYLLFKNDGYVYLGSLPDLPEISITKNFTVHTEKSDTQLVYGRGASEEERDTFNQSVYGYYLKCISWLNKEAFYIHATEVRIAYRLFDGSYVKHSPVRLLYFSPNKSIKVNIGGPGGRVKELTFSGRNEMQYTGESAFSGETDETGRITEYVWFSVMGFSLSFSISNWGDTDLSNWSDIIASIDVFSTPNMPYWGSVASNAEETQPNPGDLMISRSLFYKIGQFNLNGEYARDDKDVSSDIMATRESLDDDQGTHNFIIPQKAYSYNNKLHLYNYVQKLFEGYIKDYIYDAYTSYPGNGSITVTVYINTTNGGKVVQKSFSGVNIPDVFPSFLVYPDYRAYKMVVVIKYSGNIRSKTFFLKPHGALNIAYYFNATSSGYYDVEPNNIEDWNKLDVLVNPSNDTESLDNVLKVSNVNNPFYFPADQTYQFQTPIVGVQSNVIAMSQGQFGQFPLYVFTKDGIYAMSVGSGTLAYSTQTPVTRDVCNNPDSICGLDTMVAFSTERGLMVIDGATTQLISEKIYGFLPSCSISSPIITRILAVAGLDSCLSSVVFPDYLETAKVGYNYETKEVVVANGDFPYSYVYSLKTGEWHKISQQIDSFVNSYPYTWAMIGTQILDLNNMHRSVSKIALVTRPIKMGTLTHKRILQTALRGIVKRSLSDLYIKGEPVMFRGEGVDIFSDVGMYILASNDAEHFELVAKKEKMIDIRDLVTKMNKSKPYKYFMVCLVGGVRTDVSVNYIEMMVDESFTNRLR
jgi:hypothetical protein